jgi:hypothetical protein
MIAGFSMCSMTDVLTKLELVIEFRGPAVGVPGDALSGFKGPVVLEKIRDAGRPERVR